MEAVAPLATFHHASRVIVDDDDFIVTHDVVDIAFVEVVCLQCVVDQMRPLHVADRIEALDSGQFFRVTDTDFGQVARMLFLLQLEVNVALQLPRELVRHGVLRDIVVSTP